VELENPPALAVGSVKNRASTAIAAGWQAGGAGSGTRERPRIHQQWGQELMASKPRMGLAKCGETSTAWRDSWLWYWACVIRVRSDFPFFPISFPQEATMSAKQRRKVYGVRRESRRPRGWTRWFHEGLLEAEPAGSVRLRTVLWGQK